MKKNYQVQKPVQLPTKPTCLNCGMQLDGATAIAEGAPSEHRPGAGDVTICVYCGHLMAYVDEGALRELSDQEVREIAGDERILLIQAARRRYERTKALSRGVPTGDQKHGGTTRVPTGGAGANGQREDTGGGDDR